jgi:hypothetical protein
MKYLKEYSSYKNYIEMSCVDWENSIWTAQEDDYSIPNSIFFGRDKFKRLSSFLKKWDLKFKEMNQGDINQINSISIPPRSVMIFKYQNNPLLIIVKLEDEWYYLWNKVNETYYKCDQWDSLENCIENCLQNYEI